MVGLAVGYRLDTPAALPGQLEDAQAAVEWTREHADEYAIDPERIGVMGSSAGGHLAALLATTGRGPLTSGDRVAAAVSWSGPMDLVALTTSPQAAPPSCTRTDCIDVAAWRALLTDVIGCIVDACPLRYASLSPLWRVSPDDSPMLLVNAVAELAVSVEQARGMTARLHAFGVAAELLEVPGDGHADAYAEAAIGPTLDFLERRLG
jgi:acetyl esterase/lipase